MKLFNKDGGSQWGCCLGIMGLTVLGGLVILGVMFFVSKKLDAEISPIMATYLTSIENEEWDKAYGLAHSSYGREPFLQFSRLLATLGKHHGMSKDTLGYAAGMEGSESTIDFLITYDKGDLLLNAFLVNRGKGWRIAYLSSESPMLLELTRCPKCNAITSFNAETCEACSAPTQYPWLHEPGVKTAVAEPANDQASGTTDSRAP